MKKITKTTAGKALSTAEIKKHYDSKIMIEESMVRRAAHFFDWAATHYPKQWVPWNWALQAILGQNRTPNQDTHAVLALRASSSRIRTILQRDYRSELVIGKGLGARAAKDAVDILKTQAVKKARGVHNAIKSAQKTFDLIDAKQIPNTPDNKLWLRWLSRGINPAFREISSPDFQKKLLAPGSDAPVAKKPKR